MAANGRVAVKGATGDDWRALDCVRANGLDEGVRLVRTEPGGDDCKRFVREISPSVVIRDASRKPTKQGPSGTATLAKYIVKAFIDSIDSQGSVAGMSPKPTSLDRMGAGGDARVEGIGMHGGDRQLNSR